MSKGNKASGLSNTSKEKDSRDDSNSLPGWPGYRTRNGRSGYDPIDMRTEAAHTASTFVRDLFTGQLRIRNPILLFLSGALGLILVMPLLFAISEMFSGNLFPLNEWITLVFAGIIGLAILTNFFKNLIKTKNQNDK